MPSSGLTFCISHIDVIGNLPQKIIEGHFFRAATDQEVDAIQKRLDATSIYGIRGFGIPYKELIKEERHGGNVQFHREILPREKWKYWVIAYNGYNESIRNIEQAAILLPTDLDFGLEMIFSEENQQGDVRGWTLLPLHLLEKYSDVHEQQVNAIRVSTDEIKMIGEYYDKLKHLPPEAAFITHAIENFYSIRAIPRRSEIRVVGYFAIIESLVTHAPRSAETLDSITHQIVNKLILLRKRFGRQLNPSIYFLDDDEEKIWKKLYRYRSCLAHGDKPDFRNELKILKSHEEVINFLKEIIKELIVYGLKEYVFLADLRKC